MKMPIEMPTVDISKIIANNAELTAATEATHLKDRCGLPPHH
jgi:hypothetical protein